MYDHYMNIVCNRLYKCYVYSLYTAVTICLLYNRLYNIVIIITHSVLFDTTGWGLD